MKALTYALKIFAGKKGMVHVPCFDIISLKTLMKIDSSLSSGSNSSRLNKS